MYYRNILKTVFFTIMLVALVGCGASPSPSDVVKSFYETSLAEKPNIDAFICTSNKDAAMGMMRAMDSLKSQMSVARFDTSGLKYEILNQNATDAQVKVSGKLKWTIAAQSFDTDYPGTNIVLKNENGWKVCA